jgi:hypothetical protein
MRPRPSHKPLPRRRTEIEEVRMVSDLRIMHAKVDELYHVVSSLQRRHNQRDVIKYAEEGLLNEDIERVDHIYLWYLKLKELRQSED